MGWFWAPLMRRGFAPQSIDGLHDLMLAARLPHAFAEEARKEMAALGVADVTELTRVDWENLQCWQTLFVFEQRRLLKYM